MSAASDRESRDESHDLTAGQDVARSTDQYDAERPEDGEHDYSGRDHATNRGHGSRQSVTASSSQQQQQQDPNSPRPDLAPDLAAWDTRTSYITPSNENLLPPADFKPFFTLISDPTTGEHHHPAVHYVFADDEDQGAITSEALAVLDRDQNTAHLDEMEERVVLLDMEPDGRTVAAASSLSADWQAITAEIAQAPSWGDSKQGVERGLMLKIVGKEAHTSDGAAHNVDVRDLEGLVAQFGRQLESLDEVLGKEEARTQSEAPSVVAQSERARSSRAE